MKIMTKNIEVIKKIGYAFGANLINLIVSFIATFLIPKFLGNNIEQYGYFQIYIFYISYLGFFHLGWCDGIFLKDGGKKYEALDKRKYSGQFRLFTFIEIIISIIILLIGLNISSNNDYKFIFILFSLNIVFLLPRTMLEYFLQTTNKIKEYASIPATGRTLYGVLILIVGIFTKANYKFFIVADLIGKIVALFVAIYWCKEIVFCKMCSIKDAIKEAIDNIKVGSKLLFANIASMLITGIVRIGIQNTWDLSTYGKISFSLSLSNLLQVFISAVSLVMYPTLKNTKKAKLPHIYKRIRNGFIIPSFGILVFYKLIKYVLVLWLPQYYESFNYMSILFPICIYSANLSMLIQTYMKVFRMEKDILKINIIGVLLSFVTSFITIYWLKSIKLALLSIILNQILRSIISEIKLTKVIKIDIKKDILYEIILTSIFIIENLIFNNLDFSFIYLLFYLLYLYIKRDEIQYILSNLKQFKNNILKTKINC